MYNTKIYGRKEDKVFPDSTHCQSIPYRQYTVFVFSIEIEHEDIDYHFAIILRNITRQVRLQLRHIKIPPFNHEATLKSDQYRVFITFLRPGAT